MSHSMRAAWLFVLAAAGGAQAQTRSNPDVSLVGDTRLFSHSDAGRPGERHRFNLQPPDLELVLGGYLNPYARADAVIAWEEGEVEIEEAYATFLRGLPLATNLRVGQYLLEFGRLNPVHPHAYPFLLRPLPHESIFGPEGLRETAVRASLLLPTGDLYSELMMAVIKGGGEDDLASEDAPSDGSLAEIPGYFGRFTMALAAAAHAELAFGISALTALHDTGRRLRSSTGGVDLKYRWTPSRHRAVQIEAEFLVHRRRLEDGTATTSVGGFAYADARFRQRFHAGAIAEYTQDSEDSSQEGWRAGSFLAFAPVAETSVVRLAGHWTRPPSGDEFWSLHLQLVFSLGPHQPHAF